MRLATLFALGRIGGKDAVEILTAAATSEDEDEAAAAEEALEDTLFHSSDIPLLDESDNEWDEESDDDW